MIVLTPGAPLAAEPAEGGIGAVERLLDAMVAGATSLQVHSDDCRRLERIAADVVARAGGQADGMTSTGMPERWQRLLAWAGMPFVPEGGSVQWGRDILVAAVQVPTISDNRLLLPSPDVMASLSSLALKPLRAYVALRFGYRLQAAPALRTWRWPRLVAIVSTASLPIGGFLHGPGQAQRTTIALEPGGVQFIGI